jgi:endonuclease/exonuclease/phosphatase family metal-dependent hydrolase
MLAARRLQLPLLSILLALLGCDRAGGGAATTAAPGSASAVNAADRGADKHLTVASWNLYLGAELGPVLAASSQAELLAASTAAWGMVVKNDFHVRAGAVAEQIAQARPELVGLQEAYTWRYGEATEAGAAPETMPVVYDYVQSLLGELADRGLHYRVAASLPLTDLDAPVIRSLEPFALAYVRGTDHEIILAREDVQTMEPEAHVFPDEHLLHVSVLGQPLEVKRGWVSVLAKQQEGQWIRFASTHLEAYHPYPRALQAADLAAALAGTPRPVVLVGDLNSDPRDTSAADGFRNALAYETLVGSGLLDAWTTLHETPGYTSPFPEDLTIPTLTLDERIDHVLFRGAVTPEAMTVLGTDESSRACGVNLAGATVCLWPSDHAGLSASFLVGNPRLVALGP